MAINWNQLNEAASDYKSLTDTKDPDGNPVDRNFTGAYVKLSEIQFEGDAGSSLTIWADTVEVDQFFNSTGVTIFSRQLICSNLYDKKNNKLTPFPLKNPDTRSFCQMLIGMVRGGGVFSLSIFPSDKPVLEVPATLSDLKVATLIYGNQQDPTTDINGGYLALWDLIGRPWALTALQASYAAAVELIDLGDSESRLEARQMLEWIIACVGALGRDGNQIPISYGSLQKNAAALLTTINLRSGAIYVPSLSATFYESEADKLMDALSSYDADYNTLTITSEISKAIETVSQKLAETSNIQASPLQTELDGITRNAKDLGKSIGDLRAEFDLQVLQVENNKALMVAAIQEQKMKQFMKSYAMAAINVAKAGVAVGKTIAGDGEGAGEAVASVIEAGKSSVEAIMSAKEAFEAGSSEENLIGPSKSLIESQMAVANAFATSQIIWQEIEKGKPIPTLPEPPTAESFDTDLAWDKFEVHMKMVSEGKIEGIKGEFDGEALVTGRQYFASLQVLILYGKSVNAKMIAYAELLSRAVLLKSEIESNQKIQKAWEQLSKNSKGEKEKLEALKALIESKRKSIKRTLYLAWRNYRAAYVYIFLIEPPVETNINMKMGTGALRTAVAGIRTWVGRLLAAPGSSGKITLPNENSTIELSIPILKEGVVNSQPNRTVAILHGNDQNILNTISVAIPPAASLLDGLLPERGKIPIWITSAQFLVQGALPNEKGNFILKVSTSGSYKNGALSAGQFQVFNFETHGFASTFGYTSDGKPYIPWQVNSAIYMTPSLFTQWVLELDENGGNWSEATTLNIRFTATFRSSNQ